MRHIGRSTRGIFSPEFLADLHAGVYPDDPQLLARVYADEDAVAYLAELERVTDLLHHVGRARNFPAD